MAEINDLNITDGSNTARFPEAMAPSAVNDGARALEGLVARWHENINTSISTSGSSNAYVLAAKGTQVLFDGLVIGFDANHANTGASTLNVDSTGVKNILKHNDVALASGDIEANQKVIVVYDGTSWQMLSHLGNAPSSELSGDSSPQLAGFLDPNSNYIGMVKGADLASAAPLVIGTDGDAFDVTGTTGFAALTIAAHRHVYLQFDGILTMTHHATNLNLPGGADIVTAAGDIAEFLSTGSNTSTCVNYTRASGGGIKTGLGSIQVFTATGTWTKPAGLARALIYATGGGGGGPGSQSSKSASGAGGAGTGIRLRAASALGATETVTIGAGGAAGAGGGNNAGSGGGTTTFGSHASGNPGGGGSAGGGGGTGGHGVGDYHSSGGGGQTTSYGANGDVGGTGGSSMFGGGGRGPGDPGTAGIIYGGGGQGGRNNGAGGAGAAGIVIVEEYY